MASPFLMSRCKVGGRWKVKVEGGWKVVFMSPSTMKTPEIKAFINMVEGVEGKKP